MRFFLKTITILLLSIYHINAQEVVQIKGVILFNGSPIPEATIAIVNKNLQKQTLSDASGNYNFANVPKNGEKVIMTIKHLQYETLTQEFFLNQDQTIVSHFKETKNNALNEIVITGIKKKFIKHEADRTTVLVENNDVLNSGSTFEAITKLPGVILTSDGLVGQNGKLSSIFMDGEPTGISGDNLTHFLNNLPANSIEKIELIPNPGAKYPASFSGGIINIITKNLKTKGYTISLNNNNRINHNFKTGNAVQLLAKINRLNWNLFAGNNHNVSNQQETFKNVFENQSGRPVFTEERNPLFKHEGYYLRNGFRYNSSKKSALLFDYNLNTNNNNNLHTTRNYSENLSQNINTNSTNIQKNGNYNNEIILKYKQKLDTLGSQLDLSLNTNFYTQKKSNKLSELGENNRYTYTKQNLNTQNLVFNLDVEIPYRKYHFLLNFGTRLGLFKAQNTGYYTLNNTSEHIFDNSDFDSTLPFLFENKTFASYCTINKKIKSLSLSTGLRYENIYYKSYLKDDITLSTKNFSNLFPTVNLLYKLNPTIFISTGYSKKINLPSYANFDPNSNINSFYLSNTGNPYLEPDKTDNFNTKLTFFDYAYLSFSHTNQKTRNTLFYRNDNTSLSITQSVISLKNVQTTSINVGLPIPFGIITEGTAFLNKRNNIDQNAISYLFADLSYNKTKFNNDLYNNFEKGTFMLYLYSQIILKDEYKMFVNYNFTSKGSTDIYNLNEPIQNLDLHLSTKYLNKKLRVLLGIQNILNTSGFNANFNGMNLSSSYNRINETRMARVALTYTFGNFKSIADEDFSKNEQNLIKPVN